MNLLKKLFVYSVVITTVLWSVGASFAPLAANAAGSYPAGSLLAMKGQSGAAVYLIGADAKKHVFPSMKEYATWYPNFDKVVRVAVAELDLYPDGGAVTVRPGTKLVTHMNTAKVYAIEPGGNARWIPTDTIAKALYGNNWTSRLVDVIPGYFTSYVTTGTTDISDKYPTGTVVKMGTTYYYINGTTKRAFANDAAFTANGYVAADAVAVTALTGYTDGTSITGAETAIKDFTPNDTTVPVISGNMNVSLAASNPASVTIISDTVNTAESMVPFLAVNLTASSAGDVKVTQMKFERTGISADADVANAYLYDGTTKLVDGGSISSKVLTFNDNDANGIITVPAGTTKTVWLKGDMGIALASGRTIGFNLTALTSNASSVNATYPLVGNVMSTASATDMGYAVITSGNVPTAATSVNSNEKDFEAYKVILTANDQDMALYGLRLTKIGSIASGDINNFRLQVGGTTLATVADLDADGILYFDLSSAPYDILKGNSKTFSVKADIVKGSTRTFKFSIQYASDLVVKDKGYNVFSQSFKTSAVTWGAVTSSASTYTYTIAAGTLSIVKDTTSPSGQIMAKGTGIKVATFKVTANGEDIKIKSLDVKATTANTVFTGLYNGKIYYDGVQVGSTKNLTQTTGINFTLGSSMIVPAGTSKLIDIYADVKCSTGTDFTVSASSTAKVELVAGTDSQGMVSLSSPDVPAAVGSTLSIGSSALTAAKYAAFGDQNMTSPATHAKIGAFTITAASTEGVVVDNIYLKGATSGEVQNVSLMVGSTELASKSTMPSTNSTSTFSMGSKLHLVAGESKQVDVYGDVKSGLGTVYITTTIDADGTTTVTNTSVGGTSSTYAALQTMAIGSGAITSTAAGSKPDATIIVAGMTGVLVNAVEFTSTKEPVVINNVQITKGSSAFSAPVSRVVLEYPTKTGTATAYAYLNGSDIAQFYNLGMYVDKDSTAVLSIKADLATFSGGSLTGSNNKVRLNLVAADGITDVFSATGQLSGTTSYTGPSAVTGNLMIVRATKPTITLVALPTTVLNDGTQTISRFSVTADAVADLSWRQMSWTYTTSTGVSISNSTIKLYKLGDSTALNSFNQSLTVAGTTITVTTTNDQNITKGTSQTYELKGDITGTAADKSVSTKINGSGVSTSAAGTSTTLTLVTLYETGFIWSDKTGNPHASDGTSADWADSVYVKNLPTDSQTLSK